MVVAALALVVVLTFWAERAPVARPLDAPPDAFSAVRAFSYVEAIAQRPHRIGSAAHEETQRWLVSELGALGLVAEVQETVVQQTRWSPPRFATVRNVVARRRGSAPSIATEGRALLLQAHYDTRSMTPGASDDGYGVAALLETARALDAGAPLPRDLIFLFTDGEEEGLLGARAFVEQHPWAKEVGLVLNFEMRGNAGFVRMFQTSDGNGELVRELVQSAPHLRASSLSQAIYERMPNDTDLTEWLGGAMGLNFAAIGGAQRYHAPTDTPANADLRTLQHHGEYALGLARAFGSRELPVPRAPNATYFAAGPIFVRYPEAGRFVITGAALLTAIALAVIAIRRREATARGVARSLAASIGGAIAAAIGCGLAGWVARHVHPAAALLVAARPAVNELFFAALVALAAAIGLAASARLGRGTRPTERLVGAALAWSVPAILASIYLPGGAYLFAWPPLSAVGIGLALVMVPPDHHGGPVDVALRIAAAIPAFVLLAPVLADLAGAFGPLGAAAAIGAIVALMIALTAPALDLVTVHAPRAIPLAALAVSALAFAAALGLAPFDAAHPRPDTLFVGVDADTGRSFWLSPDPAADAWTAAVLDGATPGPSPLPLAARPLPGPSPAPTLFLARETPPVREPAPEITWLSEAGSGGDRALRFRVLTPPATEQIRLEIDGPLSAARVADRAVRLDERGGLALRYYAPPPSGIEVEVEARGPIVVRIVAQRAGFPEGIAHAIGPRPPGLAPKPGMLPPRDDLLESDMTVVTRSFSR